MTGGSPTRAWLRRERAKELRDLFAVLADMDAPWRLRVEAQARLERYGRPPVPRDRFYTGACRWY